MPGRDRSDIDFVTSAEPRFCITIFRSTCCEPDFEPIANPVSRDHLLAEGLSPVFVDYMNSWKGFVAED